VLPEVKALEMSIHLCSGASKLSTFLAARILSTSITDVTLSQILTSANTSCK
jgi:hypothetical protein